MLQVLALEADKEGSISIGKVQELLGMSTRMEVDAFLKANGVNLNYDEADLEADCETHTQLRQEAKLKAL